jgi:hypothetical protein
MVCGKVTRTRVFFVFDVFIPSGSDYCQLFSGTGIFTAFVLLQTASGGKKIFLAMQKIFARHEAERTG